MKRPNQGLLPTIMLLLTIICGIPCYAQTFYKTYYGQPTATMAGNLNMRNNAVIALPSGSYLMAGSAVPFRTQYSNYNYIQQVDRHGNRQWIKYTDQLPGTSCSLESMFMESSGNIVTATRYNGATQALFRRYTPSGDSISSKIIPASGAHLGDMHVYTADNGGYFISASPQNLTVPSSSNLRLIKLDSTFHVISDTTILDSIGIYSYGLRTADGSYVVASNSVPIWGLALFKIDHNGQVITRKVLDYSIVGDLQPMYHIYETLDKGFVIATDGSLDSSSNITGGAVIKLDSNFNFQWRKFMPNCIMNCAQPLPNGGYICAGIDRGHAQYFLTKLDSAGNVIWTSVLPAWFLNHALTLDFVTGRYTTACEIALKDDGGFALAGHICDLLANANQSCWTFLASTDSLGHLPYITINGKVVMDQNQDCVDDSTGVHFNQWMIQAQGNNGTYYGMTDNNSSYTILADTGTYHVSVATARNYWQIPACATNIAASAVYFDSVPTNLPVFAAIICPQLNVEISTNRLHHCASDTYQVTYTNTGSSAAPNAYINIAFDPLFLVSGSSIPWVTPQTGSTYRFNLGQIDVGQSGSFSINGNMDCQQAELGQTFCAEAHIYPDSICTSIDSLWDRSDIAVDATCDNQDSVRFLIMNRGTGNMSHPLNYFIVEDNVMFRTAPFQLLAAQQLNFAVKANGATWTIIAQQSEGHPGNSNPLKSVEACGRDNNGHYSKGFVTQFPQDDQDLFVSIDCHEIVASKDPNEKEVNPKGITAVGYVNENQPLKYQIQFQNTGNDTAINIIVRDTISPYLNMSTLVMGAASNAYLLEIEDSNILVLTFNQIMLPDSLTNDSASIGYFSYTISPRTALAAGTAITNRAGIYFDNNTVVMTNSTLNTITADYKQWLGIATGVPEVFNTKMLIYPNPTKGELNVVLDGTGQDSYQMTIYDLAGHAVKEYYLKGGAQTITGLDLQEGAYLYEVTANHAKIGVGKLMIY